MEFQIALLDMDEQNWNGALRKLNEISERYADVLRNESHRDLMEEVQRRRGMALAELRRFREARILLEGVRAIEYD